jgi:hypothetical protein
MQVQAIERHLGIERGMPTPKICCRVPRLSVSLVLQWVSVEFCCRVLICQGLHWMTSTDLVCGESWGNVGVHVWLGTATIRCRFNFKLNASNGTSKHGVIPGIPEKNYIEKNRG